MKGPVTSPDRPKSRDLAPLRRLLGFLLPWRARVLLAALALVAAAGAVLAFGWVIRDVVDHGLSSGDPAALDASLAKFIAVIAVMGIAVGTRVYLVSWIGERVVADLRKAVFARVLKLDATFFETTRTGEVISRLTTDTTLLQSVVASTLPIAVRNALLIVGGATMLLATSPKLTLLVVAGVPLIVLPIWWLGRRVRRLSRLSQDRVADVAANVDEVVHGIRTVQAFCHEAADQHAYGGLVEDAFGTAARRARLSATLAGGAMLFTFGAVGVVLWFGGHDVLAGAMSGGELSAFVFFAVLVAGSIGALSEVAGELLRAAGAAERLMELLAAQPGVASPQAPVPLPVRAASGVAFERCVFSYPSRPATAVLDTFDLVVQPGEQVALVGPSGAGKSTVMQLLLRFYDPQTGRVLIDGVDLREAELKALRRRVALVPQEPTIFATSAFENIRFGCEGVSREAVLEAAAAAHALEFLERLPEGLETSLGERGVRLSGGQRQRIAIARALVRDPSLLLLDEATSALDAESEQVVQLALEELMAGRTTLIIAHRLATVRKVDRIVVMERGRIVATGTHGELIAQDGLYARLAALQFRDGPDVVSPSNERRGSFDATGAFDDASGLSSRS
jgi:ATP-binding cassette subfamily B protein